MRRRVIGLLMLVAMIVFLVLAVAVIHPFGYPDVSGMDDYIIENAQRETGSNNVVAAVLFDYRGLDTLGEATILFTAVTGVLLLLRTSRRTKERP